MNRRDAGAPIRIAHASFFVDPSGRAGDALLAAWPTLARVAPAIASENCQVAVFQAAAADAQIDRDGVCFRFVRQRAPSRLERRLGHWATPLPRQVIQELSEFRPDIVHVHSLSFPRHVRALRNALAGAKVIVQDHADRPIEGWRSMLVRASLDPIDAVAFTATEQAEPFRNRGILNRETPVYAVPESSSDFVPADRTQARQRTGLAGDPCVLWLGHLDANKDPLLALEAVRTAAVKLPGIRLYMCWQQAPLLDEVQRRVTEDEVLRARVTLKGPQPHLHIQTLLQSADLFIQASHREGSGYALIEALACGTAPIVTDIPSFRMLTGHGAAGGISPVGDAAAMAESLAKWAALPDPERSARVRSHFEKHLSFPAIGSRWRSVYGELLEQ